MKRPSILVFDSGLGGLTVFRAAVALRPDADFIYLADDAGFPYGPKPPATVTARVLTVLEQAFESGVPDVVVIACNTASTLVLPPLRAAFPHVPFVGTVPAVKPAAALSRSRLVSVLATPGTVQRDYTRDLIATHAADCAVTLVGSPDLAAMAECFMRGDPLDPARVAREIAPCFVTAQNGARTDAVVLACTHYPLLLSLFEGAAPWPVSWIDPAPAIARRVASLLGDGTPLPGYGTRDARFTSGAPRDAGLRAALAGFGLSCEQANTVALCA